MLSDDSLESIPDEMFDYLSGKNKPNITYTK